MNLYPRLHNNKPIADRQMVGTREHLSHKHRLLFLSGAIMGESESHNLLLALDSLSHDPIKIVITSPGGDLDLAFLLYDTIKLIQSPVWTLGRYCASAAALILASGSRRWVMPHSKVMLHLPSGQAYGDSHDWEIQHRQMQAYKQKMLELLVECGATHSADQILEDIDRDKWMEPEETIDYGLADFMMDRETMGEWLS